jgi:hypothetical protein
VRHKKQADFLQTFKGKNLKSIAASETKALGKGAIIQGLPGATAVANKADGWFFPQAQARPQAAAQAQGRNNPNHWSVIMSTVNYANPKRISQYSVFDSFYDYEVDVPAAEYDVVYSYFISVMTLAPSRWKFHSEFV